MWDKCLSNKTTTTKTINNNSLPLTAKKKKIRKRRKENHPKESLKKNLRGGISKGQKDGERKREEEERERVVINGFDRRAVSKEAYRRIARLMFPARQQQHSQQQEEQQQQGRQKYSAQSVARITCAANTERSRNFQQHNDRLEFERTNWILLPPFIIQDNATMSVWRNLERIENHMSTNKHNHSLRAAC